MTDVGATGAAIAGLALFSVPSAMMPLFVESIGNPRWTLTGTRYPPWLPYRESGKYSVLEQWYLSAIFLAARVLANWPGEFGACVKF